MKNVILNSALHLRLEREGWRTVWMRNGVATLVRPGTNHIQRLHAQ